MFRQTAALMLFALSIPAAAQTDSKSMPAVSAAAPKPEKQLCRRIEETGSIMGGKRVCHTKAEWASIDAANSNAATNGRDVRGQGGGQPGGGL